MYGKEKVFQPENRPKANFGIKDSVYPGKSANHRDCRGAFQGISQEGKNEKITAESGTANGSHPSTVPNPAHGGTMSKTVKQSTTSTASPKTPKIDAGKLAEAEKLLQAVVGQLDGLDTFLLTLADSDKTLTSINDLSWGFGYLLRATSDTAERAQALLQEAKGGAE